MLSATSRLVRHTRSWGQLDVLVLTLGFHAPRGQT